MKHRLAMFLYARALAMGPALRIGQAVAVEQLAEQIALAKVDAFLSAQQHMGRYFVSSN